MLTTEAGGAPRAGRRHWIATPLPGLAMTFVEGADVSTQSRRSAERDGLYVPISADGRRGGRWR